MKHLTLLALVFVALVGISCTPTNAPAPLGTLAAIAPTTAPNLAQIEAARKEAKLTIYTTLAEIPALATEFNKQFPEIKIDYFQGNGEEVSSRVISEYRANTFNVDVIEDIDVNVIQLISAGVLGQYKSVELSSYPATSYDKDGAYATDGANLLVMAYNTSLVTKELAPKTWEDLLDPKWFGLIAVEPDDYPLLAYSTLAWGETRSQDFWRRLSTRNIKTVKGHAELASALGNGNIAVSPTIYAHQIEAMKLDKLPVEWVRTDPVFQAPTAVGIAKNPKNPNAARVFIDWLLSAPGQQAVSNLGRISIRPGIKTKPEGMLSGLNIYFSDPKTMGKTEDLKKQYHLYFGIK